MVSKQKDNKKPNDTKGFRAPSKINLVVKKK